MKRFACLLLLLLSLTAFAAEHPKEYYDPDAQRLMAVSTFAFGPAGFDGSLSVGERAFAAILKKKESVRYMIQVFDHGSPEARCYALVAIREFSDRLFDACDATFRTNPPNGIATMEGAIATAVPIEKMLEAIERGKYRRYFAQHEEEK